MTGLYVGPIHLSMLGAPSFPTEPSETVDGALHVAGVTTLGDGEQLKELVRNPHRRITVGPRTGVLEPIWSTTHPEMNGWYLLTSISTGRAHVDQLLGWQSFDLTAARLRQVRPVVVRSARAIDDDFSLASEALLVQPYWGPTETGEPFRPGPGGAVFAREYDPRTAIDVATPAAPSRYLRLHAGLVY